jgi:hypothetical protein
LVNVTVCAALVDPTVCALKVNVPGASVTAGTGVTPLPLKATVCGDPAALSVIVSEPLRVPVAVGVNVTAIMQFAPAATDVPQVFVSAKSPEAAIELIVRAACPLLVSVTICAALAAPTICCA